jgi:trimeric autotransporter adhesin
MKRILLTSSLFVFAACKTDKVVAPPVFTPVVTTVTVVPAANQIEIGRTQQLTVTVKNQKDSVMTGQVVTWASSNNAVATVNAAGLVTAVTRGSATITATTGGKSGTATIFVIDPTVATVTVTATVPSPFFVGATVQASAVSKDGANNTLAGVVVTWTSSDTSVSTVSSTGLITAKKAGSAVITATAGGKSGTLTVTPSLVPVSSLTLAASGDAKVGRTITLLPTLKNASGATLPNTQRVLVWASTDTTVATVDAAGVLLGMSVGTTRATCIVENKVAFLDVAVTEVGISYVVVTPDSADVAVGASKEFVAKAYAADSLALGVAELNGRSFTWVSGDNTKVAVSSSGLVIGIAAGKTTVTATVATKSATAVVRVP